MKNSALDKRMFLRYNISVMIDEGVAFMKKIYQGHKLNDLKDRAKLRKNDPKLSHAPNQKNILIVLEDTKLMQSAQYETLSDE